MSQHFLTFFAFFASFLLGFFARLLSLRRPQGGHIAEGIFPGPCSPANPMKKAQQTPSLPLPATTKIDLRAIHPSQYPLTRRLPCSTSNSSNPAFTTRRQPEERPWCGAAIKRPRRRTPSARRQVVRSVDRSSSWRPMT